MLIIIIEILQQKAAISFKLVPLIIAKGNLQIMTILRYAKVKFERLPWT